VIRYQGSNGKIDIDFTSTTGIKVQRSDYLSSASVVYFSLNERTPR
jgi:hypothetical protein